MTAIPIFSHSWWMMSQVISSCFLVIAIGRLRSMDKYFGFSPLVTESEAMICMANQAAFSQPYSGTMKTGSVVNETAFPPMSTMPTSTPCCGPTIIWSLLAPSLGKISSLKISGDIFPISGISFIVIPSFD